MDILPSGELTEANTWQVSRRGKHHTDCCHNNILQWTQSTIWYEIFKTHREDKPIDNYFTGIRIRLSEQLKITWLPRKKGSGSHTSELTKDFPCDSSKQHMRQRDGTVGERSQMAQRRHDRSRGKEGFSSCFSRSVKAVKNHQIRVQGEEVLIAQCSLSQMS